LEGVFERIEQIYGWPQTRGFLCDSRLPEKSIPASRESCFKQPASWSRDQQTRCRLRCGKSLDHPLSIFDATLGANLEHWGLIAKPGLMTEAGIKTKPAWRKT
jgi:hypothetical protein